MQAIPTLFPVIVEVPASAVTENSGPIAMSGLLGELVEIGGSRIVEGKGRIQLTVVARDVGVARRRAEEATKGRVVEVGEPTPLQHYSRQRALPYRRSLVFGRKKPGWFNQQGAEGGYMPPTFPVQATFESVDALVNGDAPIQSLTESRLEWTVDHMGNVTITDPRTKKTAFLQGDDASELERSLDRAPNERVVQMILDQYTDVLESMTEAEESPPQLRGVEPRYYDSKQQDLAIKWFAGKSLSDLRRRQTFVSQQKRKAFQQQNDDAMGNLNMLDNVLMAAVQLKEFGENLGEVTTSADVGNYDKPPRKKRQDESGEFAPAGVAVETPTQPELDKVLGPFPQALEMHEHLKIIPPEWFRTSRGRQTIVDGIDKIRTFEGNVPANALESVYLHATRIQLQGQPFAMPLEIAGKTSIHEVHLRFDSERQRDFAVRNIHRFTEACECVESLGDNEAVFKMCACESKDADAAVGEAIVQQMNISAAGVSKVV